MLEVAVLVQRALTTAHVVVGQGSLDKVSSHANGAAAWAEVVLGAQETSDAATDTVAKLALSWNGGTVSGSSWVVSCQEETSSSRTGTPNFTF